MKIYKLADFKGGWFIGAFHPTLLYTPDFEIAIKTHRQGENWPRHKQLIATEYNVLIKGKMELDGRKIMPGTIFVIPPEEEVKPTFWTKCIIAVIKVPSLPLDKVITEDNHEETDNLRCDERTGRNQPSPETREIFPG